MPYFSYSRGSARTPPLTGENPNSYLLQRSSSTNDSHDSSGLPRRGLITSSCVVGLASGPKKASLSSASSARTAVALDINALPTELLTAIFILCLPEKSPSASPIPSYTPHPRNAPLLLCQVCGFWRRLARATPFLWTNLDLGEVRPSRIGRTLRSGVKVTPTTVYGDSANTTTTTPPHYSQSSTPPGLSDSPSLTAGSSFAPLPTLALPTVAHLYTTLARPLFLLSLKTSVSRFRWEGVKTDWERKSRGWHVTTTSGAADPWASPTVLVTARRVIEDVLFKGQGVVSSRVRMFELSIDDLDDLPQAEAHIERISTSDLIETDVDPIVNDGLMDLISVGSLPRAHPVASCSNGRICAVQGLTSLHTLVLSTPRLCFSDFEWTPWMPLWMQLRSVIENLHRCWGYVEPPPFGDDYAEWAIPAFSHSAIVPSLRRVELDLPWIALVPGQYSTLSTASRYRFASLASAHPQKTPLSLLPYAQLTTLILRPSGPIPEWLVRALLVECVSLEVFKASVIPFTPPPPVDQLGMGAPIPVPAGANPAIPAPDTDQGMNVECFKAFGGDPVRRALRHRSREVGTDISPPGDGGEDEEVMWVLWKMEELRLTLGCAPRMEERRWIGRMRREQRERPEINQLGNQIHWHGGDGNAHAGDVPAVPGRRWNGEVLGDSELNEVCGWRDAIDMPEEMLEDAEMQQTLQRILGGFGFRVTQGEVVTSARIWVTLASYSQTTL